MQYYLIVSGHHKTVDLYMSELKIVHNICQWAKTFYQRHYKALNCAKKCAKKTFAFIFFPQFSLMIISEIIILHHPIQEIGIGTILSTKLQILFGFHQLLHASFFFFFFGVHNSMNFITCMDLCNQLPQ